MPQRLRLHHLQPRQLDRSDRGRDPEEARRLRRQKSLRRVDPGHCPVQHVRRRAEGFFVFSMNFLLISENIFFGSVFWEILVIVF